LWSWGCNNAWRLGDGTDINRNSPTHIGTDNDWQSVSAGAAFSMALKTDHSIYVWGYAGYGSLGNGGGAEVQIPTALGICNLATEQFTNSAVNVFPNPTKNYLNITTTATLQKTIIYNLLGAKVYEQPYNETIDVSSFANGMYVVKFYTDDNAVFVEKFVKE